MVSHNKKVWLSPILFLYFLFFWPKIENKQPDAQNAQQRIQRPALLTMNPFIPTAASSATPPPPPQDKEAQEGGDTIMVGGSYEVQGGWSVGGDHGGIF